MEARSFIKYGRVRPVGRFLNWGAFDYLRGLMTSWRSGLAEAEQMNCFDPGPLCHGLPLQTLRETRAGPCT